MGPFEYLFTLFGLLLGFILVEVLSGLVGVLQIRHHAGPSEKPDVHIGWLTPLLGVFILLDISSWWGNAWDVHKQVPLGYDTIFGGVILCSFYYFAASMVFPREPRSWPDLDDWFWLHRRQVLGCVLTANLLWSGVEFIMRTDVPFVVAVMSNTLYVTAVLIAMFARKRSWVTASLALLVIQYLSFIVLENLHRNFHWPA